MKQTNITTALAGAAILLLGWTVGRHLYNHQSEAKPLEVEVPPTRLPQEPTALSNNTSLSTVLQSRRHPRSLARTLAKSPPADAVGALRDALSALDDTRGVRERVPSEELRGAVQALSADAAVQVLVEAMQDPRIAVRHRSVNALSLLGPAAEPALPGLISMLRSRTNEFTIMEETLSTIAQIHRAPDIVSNVVVAVMEGSQKARQALVFRMPVGMFEDGTNAFAANLQPFLHSSDPEQRRYAALALARLPGKKDPAFDREFVVGVRDGLDREFNLSLLAIRELVRMGPEAQAIVPALKEVIDDSPKLQKNPKLRNVALDALRPFSTTFRGQ